jgi:alkaline phosphatase D
LEKANLNSGLVSLACVKFIAMRSLLSLQFCFFFSILFAQKNTAIVSGPMLGQIDMRTAQIWVEVKPGSFVQLWYWKKGNMKEAKTMFKLTDRQDWFSPVKFELVGLDVNTTYQYQLSTAKPTGDAKPTNADGEFTTMDLWQYHKPVPDFSFIAGSCAFINEKRYDREFSDMIRLDKPATPYGNDSSIFETLAKEKANFCIWLGDNWYTREVDYNTRWGLWYRASHDRSMPVLQNFLKAMPHYAIWDDHDYGPNNSDKSYILKEESRKVFMNYWCNPSYGMNNEGIYTKVSYADADFFLMDDRYFRSNDEMADSVDGKPNPAKRMWGKQQMDWLKNALLMSYANFKVIVTGSQTLNPLSKDDCLQHYPIEFKELMDFLAQERINGVVFLTGDRHHSEIMKYERPGAYPIYDITASSFTAGVGKVRDYERNNPARVEGSLVEANNYARISISGKARERKMKVEFIGLKGDKLAEWTVSENDIRMPKK